MDHKIAAVVLAAGKSRRMGRPKMVLPWGNTTVVGKVVSVLMSSGIEEIIVVTGGDAKLVEDALRGYPVHCVNNAMYTKDEMIISLQTGLKVVPGEIKAVMVVLGDQPQIELRVVDRLLQAYTGKRSGIMIPSHQMRRGHPWIINRELWPMLMNLTPPTRLRDFINRHADVIEYVVIDTPTIFADIDTPEAYEAQKPKPERGDLSENNSKASNY